MIIQFYFDWLKVKCFLDEMNIWNMWYFDYCLIYLVFRQTGTEYVYFFIYIRLWKSFLIEHIFSLFSVFYTCKIPILYSSTAKKNTYLINTIYEVSPVLKITMKEIHNDLWHCALQDSVYQQFPKVHENVIAVATRLAGVVLCEIRTEQTLLRRIKNICNIRFTLYVTANILHRLFTSRFTEISEQLRCLLNSAGRLCDESKSEWPRYVQCHQWSPL